MNELGIGWKRSYRYVITISLLVMSFEVSWAQLKRPQKPFEISRAGTACYPCLSGDFWKQEKRSVVRIITFREGETIMCTGTLVNNTTQDGKPYILTANHCLTNQEDVDNAVFTFNYDDLQCNEIPLSQGLSMVGGKLRAASYVHDYTLVELDHHVPLVFHPYFAGWDLTAAQKNRLSCIHHPQAGVKRIAVENDFVQSSDYNVEGKAPRAEDAFWKVREWDIGFTERGSSGGPLFDQQHRLVGTLSGGRSTCNAPFDDYFQKLSESWDGSESPDQQLRYWLDPISIGVSVMDGFDPVAGLEGKGDTITNIMSGEATHSPMSQNGQGYVGGCNDAHITTFAEEFFTPDSTTLTGIQLFLGAVEPDASGGLMVSVNAENDGAPGVALLEKYIPYTQLKFSANFLEFYPGVRIAGKFFITFSPDCAATDQFAVYQAYWSVGRSNTAWAKRDSNWIPMNELNAEGLGSSFHIEAILSTFQSIDVGRHDSRVLNLYPNPTASTLVCVLPSDESSQYKITVYNSRGQIENVNIVSYKDHFILDVSHLDPGVHFLKASYSDRMLCSRFLKL